MTTGRRRTSPSTLHIHHRNGSTVTTNRCTKSFHILPVDPIGKVWEITLIVALINSMLVVMMILLLKSSCRGKVSLVPRAAGYGPKFWI
jgi:hypothetical protein